MTAASSPEDSGTAAPDPRIGPLVDRRMFASPKDDMYEWLAALDAADRAAGVIRVRVDDDAVEKVAKVLALRDYEDYGKDTDAATEAAWAGLTDYGQREYLIAAQTVLEALVTP